MLTEFKTCTAVPVLISCTQSPAGQSLPMVQGGAPCIILHRTFRAGTGPRAVTSLHRHKLEGVCAGEAISALYLVT